MFNRGKVHKRYKFEIFLFDGSLLHFRQRFFPASFLLSFLSTVRFILLYSCAFSLFYDEFFAVHQTECIFVPWRFMPGSLYTLGGPDTLTFFPTRTKL